jgi:hypothetical protein
MKMKNFRAFFITGVLLAFVTISQAQSTGLGIGTTAPAASSILDLTSTNRGILLPRVALNNKNDVTTISSPAASLLIYNTTSGGSPPNDVDPGFYYWSGSVWKSIKGFTSHNVGDNYGGGIIFYVFDNGLHGLIAATTDLNSGSGMQWYNGSSVVTNAVRDGICAGDYNTELIIGKQGPGSYAADTCGYYRNGYINGYPDMFGDWYLPSGVELDTLYSQRTTVGGFTTGIYWSSTEYNSTNAIGKNFNTGTKSNYAKSNSYYVRAIRAF